MNIVFFVMAKLHVHLLLVDLLLARQSVIFENYSFPKDIELEKNITKPF